MAEAPSSVYERLKIKLKMRLVDVLDGSTETARGSQQPAQLKERLRQVLKSLPPDEHAARSLSSDEQERLIRDVLDEVTGYGPLERLLSDQTISEIMVNGPKTIFVERDGHLQRVEETFRDTNHLMSVIERMLGSANVTVNESSPLCDATLPNGSRINVIIPPLTLNGPVVTIRRKLPEWTMPRYLATNALSPQAAEFLGACVKAKVNLVISGGTSTGKTTLVAILASYIPNEQRIITIENVAELDLPGHDHWIRLVAKPPNAEGRGEIPLRSLVKNALRMRPDRIILGEARAGEALDIVQAMHSGHDGFMTVLHANSPMAALQRLETLMMMSGLELPALTCRAQIAGAIDLVVHLERLVDGNRQVTTMSQVIGASATGFEMEALFELEPSGACRYTGAVPKMLNKFRMNHVPVPEWVKQTR